MGVCVCCTTALWRCAEPSVAPAPQRPDRPPVATRALLWRPQGATRAPQGRRLGAMRREGRGGRSRLGRWAHRASNALMFAAWGAPTTCPTRYSNGHPDAPPSAELLDVAVPSHSQRPPHEAALTWSSHRHALGRNPCLTCTATPRPDPELRHAARRAARAESRIERTGTIREAARVYTYAKSIDGSALKPVSRRSD